MKFFTANRIITSVPPLFCLLCSFLPYEQKPALFYAFGIGGNVSYSQCFLYLLLVFLPAFALLLSALLSRGEARKISTLHIAVFGIIAHCAVIAAASQAGSSVRVGPIVGLFLWLLSLASVILDAAGIDIAKMAKKQASGIKETFGETFAPKANSVLSPQNAGEASQIFRLSNASEPKEYELTVVSEGNEVPKYEDIADELEKMVY